MISDLKALALTLTAILALSAMVASAASAQQGKGTADGPISLDMTEIAGATNAFTAFGAKIECPGSTHTARKTLTTAETEAGKTHEPLSIFFTSITWTSHLVQANCKAIEGGTTHKATVTLNGCDYDAVYHSILFVFVYAITTDIVCPTGKDIEVEVYAFAGSELGGVACTLTTKAQTNLAGATVKSNTGADDLEMSGTLTNVVASRSGFGCATEETKTASIDIGLTVTGTNSEGKATGITVTS